jgi:hypothetical protein
METKDQIWIELPVARDKTHADEICAKANRMLTRLGKPKDLPVQREFFWNDHEHQYCFGGDMGCMTLTDRGTWFNLDYLGREGE